MRKQLLFTLIPAICLFSCSQKKEADHQTTHTDASYLQDYSIKYNIADSGTSLYKVYADRNGVIQILSSKGLLHPFSGALLYPGTLVPDDTYRPMKD
ncbi:hypothetical protein, partial [Agriterribacter sp.]|uniref:hypothetical protein n=1 Tax=Agriterribacter sp. TaxID=2821509 RepID=UPI002BCD3082